MHFETEKTYFRRIFVTFYKFLNSLFEGITFEREMSKATFVTLLLKFDVVDFTAFMSAFDHRVKLLINIFLNETVVEVQKLNPPRGIMWLPQPIMQPNLPQSNRSQKLFSTRDVVII